VRRQCAWCGKHQGFKGPLPLVFIRWLFGRLETTHGICRECSEKEREKYRRKR